ncbi:MAG: transcriptional regulator [Clostridia bacterium]|nr:transcriptional regulator [Clostridia bacterium]MBQ6427100.1 transcriptional regulator [Clostridia bacterium]MBR0445440.1 transcriptional regulator [Clostridia bacterium]
MDHVQNQRKIKLVKLLEILRQETDEQHPLTTKELCDKLADIGIPCDRKVLYQDIALLNEEGYEIMILQQGHNKAYYIADRSFSVPELKILIDAVQAASFITESKTADLMDKIASLGGSHEAELLKSSLICFNTRKHSNESIYYNVNALEDAIRNRVKASFCYFDLAEKGKRVFRKKGERYTVEPLALIFNNDNYYLVCFDDKNEDGKATYRVDRMDGVQAEEEPISGTAMDALNTSDFAVYTEQAFAMFGGPAQKVVLEFDESLINPVLDQFGEDVAVRRVRKGVLKAKVSVQVSPTFFGWLAQFPGKMKILSPDELERKYLEHLSAAGLCPANDRGGSA